MDANSRKATPRKSRALAWVIGLLVLGTLACVFPPFHIVSLRQAQQQQQQGAFTPASFAQDFWTKQLLPTAENATPIAEVLAALAKDPKAARQQFGRSLGLSATTYFLVKGSGHVAAIDTDSIRITVDGAPPDPAVVLYTDLLFGNTIRDSTGLLDVSKFPNSQDFNDLSTALNHIVETEVAPALRQNAVAGKSIHFAGCIELDEGDVPKVLQVIPVKIDWP
jgi:predicted lipoprotein